MLIFSHAEVAIYTRGRVGDGDGHMRTDGQMHSTGSVMRWHFYNRLLAALFC